MAYLSYSQLKSEDSVFQRNANRKSFSNKRTVFLSHSHKDKDIIERVIGFLLLQGTNVYVDWLDSDMPQITGGETATKLKTKINECEKFVVLFTENSKESKWVPWELGYADSVKPIENIAIFPLKRYSNTSDSYFNGVEYFELYPIIKEGFLDGERYSSIFPSERVKTGGDNHGKKLDKWLDKKSGVF